MIMAPNGMSEDQADRAHLMGISSTSSSTSEDACMQHDYQSKDKFGVQCVHVVNIPEDRASRTMALVGTKNPYLSDVSVSKSPKSKKAKFCFLCTIILILALVGVTVTATVEIVLKSQQDNKESTTDREAIAESVFNTTSTIQHSQSVQPIEGMKYDAFESETSDNYVKDSRKSNDLQH